jgi:hypothetical protein
VRCSGSAAVAIGASNIATTDAVAKRAGSSVELPTAVIATVPKEDWTNGTVSGPIAAGWLQFPLWIKVPPRNLPQARSPRRHPACRLPPKMAADN